MRGSTPSRMRGTRSYITGIMLQLHLTMVWE